jgi:hypothetical protein
VAVVTLSAKIMVLVAAGIPEGSPPMFEILPECRSMEAEYPPEIRLLLEILPVIFRVADSLPTKTPLGSF